MPFGQIFRDHVVIRIAGLDLLAAQNWNVAPSGEPACVCRQVRKSAQPLSIEWNVSLGVCDKLLELVALMTQYQIRRPPLGLFQLEKDGKQRCSIDRGQTWPSDAVDHRIHGHGRRTADAHEADLGMVVRSYVDKVVHHGTETLPVGLVLGRRRNAAPGGF